MRKEGKEKKNNKLRFVFPLIIVVICAGILFYMYSQTADSKELRDAKRMQQEEFVSACQEADYESITADPDVYMGKYVKATVKVDQPVGESSYHVYVGDLDDEPDMWYEEEYILLDESEDGIALENDGLYTVYGVYTGEEKITRSSSGTGTIAGISILYAEKATLFDDIEAMAKGLEFEETSEQYTFHYYEATATNTTDITFDTFLVDIELQNENGEVIDTTYASVTDWNPGDEAVFEFSTDIDFDKAVVTNHSYYKE